MHARLWLGSTVLLALCMYVPGCGDNKQLSVEADATVVPEGSEVTFSVDAFDVTWDFGDGQQDTGSSVRHYFADDGDHHVVATSGGWSGSIDITVENVAPTLELGDAREWAPGRALVLAVELDDPGIFDDVTATVDWGDGTVETLDDKRSRHLDLEHVYAEGSFTAVVTVADEVGSSSDSVPIKVWPHQVIVIDANVPTWTAVGTPITGIVSAADLDGTTVPIALTSAPSGMTLDGAGVIRWTPGAADAGVHDIVLAAGKATRRISVTVSAVEIAASTMISATAGGTIEVDDPSSPLHGARVEVPAGALASDTVISIGRLVTPPPDGRDEPVGEAIELMPSGTAFAKEVTLRLPSARSDVSIATFSTHALHQRNTWVDLDHRTVLAGAVSGTVRHFTPFRLFTWRRTQLFSNDHFTIYYELTGRDAPPMGSKYKAAGTAYVSRVPPFVQDLAAALEQSYQAYDAGGYAPVLGDRVSVRIANRYTSETLEDGTAFGIVFTNWYPDTATVRGTAAHELFHKCQFHSFGADPDAQVKGSLATSKLNADWMWEATATHKALEVMGGKEGGGWTTMGWLRDYGFKGTDGRGYAAFPLFKFLLSRKRFDFTYELWAVRDSAGKAIQPSITKLDHDGVEYAYERVRTVAGAIGEHRLWGELAYAFQYGHNEAWMNGVKTWLDPVPMTSSATPTTGLERATPATGEQLPIRPTVVGVMANPDVLARGIQTFAIAPRCTAIGAADCAARKAVNAPASDWELVLRAGMGEQTKGSVYIAPFDPAKPATGVEPIFAGELVNGKELAIPLTSVRGDYDQIVVSIFNASNVRDRVPLEAFFRRVTGRRLVTTAESACWRRRPDDRVWCWGQNIYGELSNGTLDGFFTDNTHPTASPVLLDATTYLAGVDRIWSNGDAHQMCVTQPLAVVDPGQSAVLCWGAGGNNQFNTGIAIAKYAYPVLATTGEIRNLATYGSSSCAVVENGGVDCWGLNFNYQLGNRLDDNLPSPRGPVLDASSNPITGAAAVGNSWYGANCAVMVDGTVRCWGSNIRAGLGQPSTLGTSPSPIPVPGITDAVAISAGSSTCVLKADATVRCWGSNPGGEVGDGTTQPHFLPFDPGVSDIVQISVGWATACALDRSGVVWCWGNNDSYQLGRPQDPTAYIGLLAAPVAGLPPATEISVGANFSCALVGDVPWCWGWNSSGQLGDGMPVPGFPYGSRYQPAPILVP